VTTYTKALRQEIIKDFAARHDGHYDPIAFVGEVKAAGPVHPAYAWFEWDQKAAAREHNIWQARMFAQGLKIVFTIEEIRHNVPVTITYRPPQLISPIDTRHENGGYVALDLDDQEGMAELGRQAATALRSWLARYGVCLAGIGETGEMFDRVIEKLDGVRSQDAA
jgi:hypothetical protein